jgi:hypothetical protein
MISIHYSNGRVLHGVVLAFGDRLMRVAVKGSDDAVEFRLVSQVWVSEDCEVVKLEFAELDSRVPSEQADPQESLFHFESQAASLQRLM